MLKFRISTIWILLLLPILMLCRSASADLPPDIVIALTFDEEKDGVIPDISGNGNNAELRDAKITEDGVYGSALLLNGSADAVVKDSEELNPVDKISILAWVKISQWVGWARVCEKGAWENDSYILLTFSAAPQIGFTIKSGGARSGGGASYTKNSPIKIGEWHHWAGVYDGVSMIIYIDGEVANEQPFENKPIDVVEDDLFLGSTGVGSAMLNGVIDDFMISNKAMTQEEVKIAMEGLALMGAAVSPEGTITTTWSSIKSGT